MGRLVMTSICCLAMAVVATSPALAQQRPEIAAAGKAEVAVDLSGWADGPAGFLLTKSERKQWEGLSDNRQRRRFIDLFWARRDPDPEQPFNTFKAHFESRVRYADENFSYDGVRGALTDRGRVLILMGPPHQAEHRMPTETVRGMNSSSGAIDNRATDEVRAHAELWEYDPNRLPDGFKIRGSRLMFVFYEEKAETNQYVLDRSHPEASMAMRAMARAPEVYLLHPDLETVPTPVSVPGGKPASPADLAWLDSPSAPYTSDLRALAEPGLAGAQQRPLWLDLELPAAAPELEQLAGRVSTPDGEVLSTFVVAAAPLTVGDHRAYQLTFPLGPGSYRLDVAGAAGGKALAVYSASVEIPEMPTTGVWLSPVWVGRDSQVEGSATLGAAFCFGRLHLMPLLTGEQMSHSGEVSFLGFAVRPGLTADGKPSLRAKITLTKDGRQLGRPLDMPLEGVKLVEDVWVYMNGISLAGLPGAGSYGLTFEVSDTLGKSESPAREVVIDVVD